MNSRWLIFVLSVKCYPAVASLRISVRGGIRGITNRSGDGNLLERFLF